MRRISSAFGLLALVTACHSSTEPPRPVVYQLVRIDGRPLPTTRQRDGATVLHEELILNAQGVAMRNTTVQGTSSNIVVASSVSYAYTREGSVITLGATLCPSGATCALHSAEEGTINGGLLTLMSVPSLSSVSGSVYVYEFVGGLD